MNDRKEWARKAEEEHQERMKGIRERNRKEKEETERKAEEMAQYAGMVETMLQHLCSLSPEWEERKRAIQEV